MVDFVVDNYLLIIIITVFLIFALIGYIIDSSKNKKNKEEGILTEKEDVVIEEIEKNPIFNENINEVNELAENEQEDVNEEFKIPEIEENE